jgi:hypothetical protein
MNLFQNQWTSKEMGNWTKQNFLKRRNSKSQKTHEKKLTISSHKGNANQNHTYIPLHLVWIGVVIKNSTNNTGWRGCGEKWTLLHCWWECMLVQPLWKTIWRLLKNLNIDLPYDLAIPLLGIYQRNVWLRLLQRHLHTHFYCISIHNSQVMEIAKMPHYWRMD